MSGHSLGRDFVASTPRGRAAGRVITVVSVALIAMLTLAPGVQRSTFGHLCVVCGVRGGVDFVLNVLLFVPLGLGLALVGVRRALLIVVCCTTTVELMQLLVIPGRDATVGDIVANSLGGWLGILLSPRWIALLRPDARHARKLMLAWLAAWLAGQGVFSFSITSRAPEPPYFGQLRIFPPSTPVFPGRVLSFDIGERGIADGGLSEGDQLRALLDSGSSARVVAEAPRAHASERASIVRLAALNDQSGVSMEQENADLVYAVRTGADVLRLRRWGFRLRNAFPIEVGPGTDTVALRGRYHRGTMTLAACTKNRVVSREISLGLGDSWRLFLPFPVYVSGSLLDAGASALFVFALLLPAGYWMHRAARDASPAAWMTRGLAAVGLVVGLALVPVAFGLRVERASAWFSAVAAFAFGSLLSRGALRD